MPNQTQSQLADMDQLGLLAGQRLDQGRRITATELNRQAELIQGYGVEASIRREELMNQYPYLASIHNEPLRLSDIFHTESLGRSTVGVPAEWSVFDEVATGAMPEPQKKPDLSALEKLVNEIASHLSAKGNDTDLFYANRIKQEFENARQF